LQIFGWAKAIGVTVKTSALREDWDWKPDLNEIESLITPKTKFITICHPNNPTGALLELADMEKLVELARKHDLYLHADEVYKGVGSLVPRMKYMKLGDIKITHPSRHPPSVNLSRQSF